jgi:hypothetical protein
VAIVVNVWHTASNHPMPARRSATDSATDSTRYTLHTSTAVCRIRGVSFSTVGPGASAA